MFFLPSLVPATKKWLRGESPTRAVRARVFFGTYLADNDSFVVGRDVSDNPAHSLQPEVKGYGSLISRAQLSEVPVRTERGVIEREKIAYEDDE